MENSDVLKYVENILRNIIEILNDIIDFEIHKVFFINEDFTKIYNTWHYIAGFTAIEKSKEKKLLKENSPLRNVIINNIFLLLDEAYLDRIHKKNYKRDPFNAELWFPLKFEGYIIGALRLIAKDKDSFSENAIWLCKKVINYAFESWQNEEDKRIWEKLRYCILNRKYYLSGTPSINEISKEYLKRFKILLPKKKIWGTVRILEKNNIFPIKLEKTYNLTFSACFNIKDSVWAKTRKKEIQFSQNSIDIWLDNNQTKPQNNMVDLDPAYHKYFNRKSMSHIILTSRYSDKLVALFTFDSSSENMFNTKIIEPLSILAVHAAPTIANAKYRTMTTEHRDWLQAILDAIGDEVIVIDKKGLICQANSQKKDAFIQELVGKYCFNVFENQKKMCKGCYSLKAIEDSKPIRQAYWQYKYKNPATDKIEERIVEITTAPIYIKEKQTDKAVEVVRDVTSREKLLRVIERIYNQLLKGDEKWLYNEFTKCLAEEVGFRGVRLYLREHHNNHDVFVLKACSTNIKKECFQDSIIDNDFDEPIKALLKYKKLIHFVITQKKIKNDQHVKRLSKSYIQYQLNKLPEKYEKIFGNNNISEWVEFPLIRQNEVIGKIIVDNINRKDISGKIESSFNSWDIALLVLFCRFASFALQFLYQQDEVKYLISVLKEFDEWFIEGQPTEQLLQLIVDQTNSLIGPCCAIIRLWDSERNEFNLTREKKPEGCPGIIPLQIDPQEGVSGLALQQKRLVCIQNTRTNNEWLNFIKKHIGDEKIFLEWIGSAVGIPLIFRGRIHGTLAVGKSNSFGFTKNDLYILKYLAVKASAALEYSALIEAKIHLVRNIAHSLKGPVVPISTYTQMIQKGLVTEKEKIEYCTRILGAVETYNRITAELIDVAKIERSNLKNKIDFSVTKEVDNVVNTIKSFRDADILIKNTTSNDIINGFPFKFREIIYCLLDNAIIYCRKNSKIEILITNDDSELHIQIIDNGIGMTKDDIKNAFKYFFRGSYSKRMNDQEVQGTGLGLYIVKEYTDQMQGKVEITSILRKGTTVNLTFPFLNQGNLN